MQKVFVSSVMRDFGDEREAVRAAIESLGMQALMAEKAPASVDPSREALLPLVDEADVVVLILGARYGYIAASRLSPTEEEFNAARASSTPVLAFVQRDVETEPAQQEFIARVGGGWEQGAFTGFFRSPAQLGMEVVKALNAMRLDADSAAGQPEAQARALDLVASAGGRRRHSGAENGVHLALVPVGGRQLIDALVLEDAALQERYAGLVRQHGLISQRSGIDVAASSAGLIAIANQAVDYYSPAVIFAGDGAVVVDTHPRAEGGMGMMALSLPKIEAFVAAATAFAQDAWELSPESHRVRQVAACIGVPQPSMQALSLSGQVGSSMRMPQLPSPLVAPQPAAILRRADVSTARSNELLTVSLKRAYADHDALAD